MTSPVTFLDGRVTLWGSDCLTELPGFMSDSFDAVVTDPPYELGFMGKSWDATGVAFSVGTWQRILNVLKPGGYLVAFGAPRNGHRLTCAIEDAGFEIRDDIANLIDSGEHARRFVASLSPGQFDALVLAADDSAFLGRLLWAFGQGWPKSLNVSKAIDKAARGVPQGGPDPTSINHGKFKGGCSEENPGGRGFGAGPGQFMAEAGEAATEERELVAEARPWVGFGTALKPAYEPIILARKPLAEGTVAAQVLATGTGALNIDGCRVATDEVAEIGKPSWGGPMKRLSGAPGQEGTLVARTPPSNLGRWPANIVHDGSEEVVGAFPANLTSGTGAVKKATGAGTQANAYGKESRTVGTPNIEYGDTGSAARFFYTAKADSDDRLGSRHPTIKPIDLMRWLVRLVTPPGGTILDPFAGTGTTGEAAYREGFNAVLIERETEYQADIARRMELVLSGRSTRKRATAKKKAETRPVDDGPLFGASP